VAPAGLRYILQNYPRPLWGTCLDNYVPLYKKYGAVEVNDPRRMPAYFRRRRWQFNLILRLLGRNKRLAVIVFPV